MGNPIDKLRDNKFARKAVYLNSIKNRVEEAIPSDYKGLLVFANVRQGEFTLVAHNASISTSARFISPAILKNLRNLGFKGAKTVTIKLSPETTSYQMELLQQHTPAKKNYPSSDALRLMREEVEGMPKDKLSHSLSNLINSLSAKSIN